MKMKITYQRVGDVPPLLPLAQGDWIDLTLAEDVSLRPDGFGAFSLGIRMQLPEGFEAHVLPRSSTGKRYKVIMYNSEAIMDESYRGPEDIWHVLLFAPVGAEIPKSVRIAQFRIVPKMGASAWVKLKWLLTSKVEFVETSALPEGDKTSRGGFGSTGI